MKKEIPNILTLLNLFSGCIAITMAFRGDFTAVVIWVAVAALFDFFDGLAARSLGVASKMGVELDSLADLVSFGLAPATAVFKLLQDHTLLPDLPQWSLLYPSRFRSASRHVGWLSSISTTARPPPSRSAHTATGSWVASAVPVRCRINGFYLTRRRSILGTFVVDDLRNPMFSPDKEHEDHETKGNCYLSS